MIISSYENENHGNFVDLPPEDIKDLISGPNKSAMTDDMKCLMLKMLQEDVAFLELKIISGENPINEKNQALNLVFQTCMNNAWTLENNFEKFWRIYFKKFGYTS